MGAGTIQCKPAPSDLHFFCLYFQAVRGTEAFILQDCLNSPLTPNDSTLHAGAREWRAAWPPQGLDGTCRNPGNRAPAPREEPASSPAAVPLPQGVWNVILRYCSYSKFLKQVNMLAAIPEHAFFHLLTFAVYSYSCKMQKQFLFSMKSPWEIELKGGSRGLFSAGGLKLPPSQR